MAIGAQETNKEIWNYQAGRNVQHRGHSCPDLNQTNKYKYSGSIAMSYYCVSDLPKSKNLPL